MGIEHGRLREMHPAVARRILRAAARRLGARLSFDHTEQLLAMTGPNSPRAGKFDLPGGIMVERSFREIRLMRGSTHATPGPEHAFVMPGEVRAPEYGVSLRVESASTAPAILRPWKPGIG